MPVTAAARPASKARADSPDGLSSQEAQRRLDRTGSNAVAAALASLGVAMAAWPVALVAGTLAAAALFGALLGVANIPVFARLKMA